MVQCLRHSGVFSHYVMALLGGETFEICKHRRETDEWSW